MILYATTSHIVIFMNQFQTITSIGFCWFLVALLFEIGSHYIALTGLGLAT